MCDIQISTRFTQKEQTPLNHRVHRCRLLALWLILATSLPILASAFAGTADDLSVPACCRRDGKHHCLMSQAERAGLAQQDEPTAHLAALREQCPYAPATVPVTHTDSHAAPGPASLFARITNPARPVSPASHPLLCTMDPAHPRRGPPVFSSIEKQPV